MADGGGPKVAGASGASHRVCQLSRLYAGASPRPERGRLASLRRIVHKENCVREIALAMNIMPRRGLSTETRCIAKRSNR
jgi:hypothetical protein